MRVTARDVRLVRDLALSHVLSRDQIIELGYFDSVTRVNTRLRELVRLDLVRHLDTPFFSQRLYAAGCKAGDVVGGRIANLISSRSPSPRFLQHALATTNVRIALMRKSPEGLWRFEQQLWRKLSGSTPTEIRPDGLFLAKHPIFVEVDMGHVAPAKFKEKLLGYRALAHSGQCRSLYGFDSFNLLVVTTGSLRSRRLHHLLPANPGFAFLAQTFSEVGAPSISTWS